MTWSDIALAGAFALGTVSGAIGVILVLRYVLGYLRAERDKRE